MKDMDVIESGVNYQKAWDAGFDTAKTMYEVKINRAKAKVKECAKDGKVTVGDVLNVLEGLR